MKTINRVVCTSHVLSICFSMYLGNYSIQQPIEANNWFFPISLTDGVILSIFLFLMIFIGNIFGSVASYFNFSAYPLLSMGLGIAGICGLMFFAKSMTFFSVVFGILSLFQLIIGLSLVVRSANLMKIR
ncbi:hypothetical protein E1H99_00570 [Enterococcus hirae]|nr:hypothetical protein [Enterococcus sp. 10A9_DIV0425]THE16082.1 hypothetical protein E1H99_00570 [Enterococcus hirae]